MTIQSINLHIGEFGEIGGSNASAAVQAMFDEMGFITVPPGVFECRDEIIVPTSASPGGFGLDSLSHGFGKQRSVLKAVGMDGASLFRFPAQSGQLARMTFRDFGLVGDADHAFNMSGATVFRSQFCGMAFHSKSAAALFSPECFSVGLNHCDFASEEGDGVDLTGGNTLKLDSCYVIKAGEDRAGYRLRRQATLLNCNGMDKESAGAVWGRFGEPGEFFRINLMGCNIEDFRSAGIELDSAGWLVLENTPFIARDSGTFETFIKANGGNGTMVNIGLGVTTVSKGASRTASSNIVTARGARVLTSHNNQTSGGVAQWPDLFRTDAALLCSLPNIDVQYGPYATYKMKVSGLA